MSVADVVTLREKEVYRKFLSVLQAFRPRQVAEPQILDLLVQAEICLAKESERLQEPFPNLEFVAPPRRHAQCAKPDGKPMHLETELLTAGDRL